MGGTGSGKATVRDLSFWLAAAGTSLDLSTFMSSCIIIVMNT